MTKAIRITDLKYFVCLPFLCIIMIFSFTSYAISDQNNLELQFLQEIDLKPNSDSRQMLGISALRYESSEDASSGKLILLSDDTGAVKNIYGDLEIPHMYYVDFDCNGIDEEEPCQYKSRFVKDNIDYDSSFLTTGLDESQIDSNQIWCTLLYIGSYITEALPACTTDVEGMELLTEDNNRLLMEEQVVGATYSTPAVLLLDNKNKVVNKYSFPFPIFGFKRSSSNKNLLETGVRPNGGFEGIAEVAGEKGYYAAVSEFPLKQDKKRNRMVLFSLGAGAGENGGEIIIDSEYYYDIDEVTTTDSIGIKKGYPKTGVSDILAINNSFRSFITIERTAIRYIDNSIKSVNKLFFVSIPNSEESLVSGELPNTSVIKKEISIDTNIMNGFNIEGLTWGPELVTGEKTLILVNDNDAGKAKDATRLFVFKVKDSFIN